MPCDTEGGELSRAAGRPVRPRVVLLDAMGTLLALRPPGPLLAARLAAAGVPIDRRQAERAFRVEIDYYREHHLEGFDRASVAALRHRCAAAMHAALPARTRERIAVESLREAMLAALRFEPAPHAIETLRALRAMDMRLIVLSNWDVSLEEALAQTRLRPELDGLVTSAGFGAAKPDPAIFEHALEIAGATPQEAIHVGDSPQLDVAGAQSAAIQPVLLGAASTPGVPAIASLAELPGLIEALGAPAIGSRRA